MAKKKILIGDTENKASFIFEQIEHMNIPFTVDIEKMYVIKRSSEELLTKACDEEYEFFLTFVVQKRDIVKVEAIIAQHASPNERDEWQKKAKKIKRKETFIFAIWIVIYSILILTIEVGKTIDGNSISYIACFILWLGGTILTVKNYREYKRAKEEKLLKQYTLFSIIFGSSCMIHAFSSFLTMNR
ncbi:hypothetical protein FQ087_03185 [Sporosarcina sp. ANT_H38]|uniref:hypothetical protein n=1 Tax=Sporosarcina sp. ANT_H38 TaxID=2597358 RepID=UPI0011F2EADE|nr:hypothetical protein [Sporosarcina sp. ANT_H38]KAA0965325.1 hypothetical protein FQ087_03185 [Sporosarcina sp. ANT_H38]